MKSVESDSPEIKSSSAFGVSRYQKWFIWGIAALFYLYETFLRVSPSVMTADLMRDFGVNSTTLGVLSSCYYYAYVILQIPCGIIVDKLGIRIIVTCSALLCVVGTLLFATSESIFLAQLGRFLIGAGSACAFISCLKVTVEWFNPLHFAFVAGLTNMMGTIGGVCAGRPLAIFVNNLGWRQASFRLALIGIGVALVACLFLKNHPRHAYQSSEERVSLKEGCSYLARNKQVWFAGIVGGLMYLPISAFAELWGVPFLMHAYGINNEVASSASVMIFVGTAIGSPFAAFLVSRFKSILKVMRFSALISGVLFIGIAYTALFPLSVAFLMMFLAGFFIGGQVLCFTIAQNSSSSAISGTTIGFTNALVMLSGALFQPLLGGILDFFWDGATAETGVHIYSAYAYQMSILTIPLSLLASLLVLRFIKETYATETKLS